MIALFHRGNADADAIPNAKGTFFGYSRLEGIHAVVGIFTVILSRIRSRRSPHLGHFCGNRLAAFPGIHLNGRTDCQLFQIHFADSPLNEHAAASLYHQIRLVFFQRFCRLCYLCDRAVNFCNFLSAALFFGCAVIFQLRFFLFNLCRLNLNFLFCRLLFQLCAGICIVIRITGSRACQGHNRRHRPYHSSGRSLRFRAGFRLCRCGVRFRLGMRPGIGGHRGRSCMGF